MSKPKLFSKYFRYTVYILYKFWTPLLPPHKKSMDTALSETYGKYFEIHIMKEGHFF